MNGGLHITWPVIVAIIGLLAFAGPVLVYIGRWMHRTDQLEEQMKKVWQKMDERDQLYTDREHRMNRRLASVEQVVAACPIKSPDCPLDSEE